MVQNGSEQRELYCSRKPPRTARANQPSLRSLDSNETDETSTIGRTAVYDLLLRNTPVSMDIRSEKEWSVATMK